MSAAILVTHLCACFFYYSSYLEGFDPVSHSPSSHLHLLLLNDVDLQDTWVGISGLQLAPNFDKYVTALYWSMSTLTTVGYGDVIPGNSNEKIMSMIGHTLSHMIPFFEAFLGSGMVIGVTVFAYFMGSMSSMMSSLNNANTRITKRTMVDRIKAFSVRDAFRAGHGRFLKEAQSPDASCRSCSNILSSYSLSADRRRRNLHHQWFVPYRRRRFEAPLHTELSLPLRTELILYLYRDILGGVPFFKGKDPQFIVRIVPLLRLEYYGPVRLAPCCSSKHRSVGRGGHSTG